MGYDIEMPVRLASLFSQDQEEGVDVSLVVRKDDLFFKPVDGSPRLAEKAKPEPTEISNGKKTFVVTRVDESALPMAQSVAAPVVLQIDTPAATPLDTPLGTPLGTPVETPLETRLDTPLDTPPDTPPDTPINTPLDIPLAAPAEAPAAATAPVTGAAIAAAPVAAAITPAQAHPVSAAVAVDALGAQKDKGIKSKIQALYRSLVEWLEGRHARKARAWLVPTLNVQQLDWRGLEEVASRTKLRYGKLDHLVEQALKGMDQETLLELRQQVDALDIEELEKEVYGTKPLDEQWKMYRRRQIKWMPMDPALYTSLISKGEFLSATLLDNQNFEVVKDLRRALLAVIDKPAEIEKREAEWALLLQQAAEEALVKGSAAASAA